MEIARTGIILNVGKYDECVKFYRDIFKLPVMFEKTDGNFKLTCLEFGSSYLMIETGGYANPAEKSINQNPSKIRFNVNDIEVALITIQAHGIKANIESNTWGNTINIHDPDGNRVGIRDESTFIE